MCDEGVGLEGRLLRAFARRDSGAADALLDWLVNGTLPGRVPGLTVAWPPGPPSEWML
ncbi:hypothetical protein MTY66_63770 (plasmid) [Mycolicibacterium sp. TY66]|nr:hypothetical protein MTY66_63770 [Mycolicibacterium sp. TY66]BCJ84966.1 hypothetical protein MTY81_63390 [Mycolicibacterium sp. TY81]